MYVDGYFAEVKQQRSRLFLCVWWTWIMASPPNAKPTSKATRKAWWLHRVSRARRWEVKTHRGVIAMVAAGSPAHADGFAVT